jgi:hypothetical protein
MAQSARRTNPLCCCYITIKFYKYIFIPTNLPITVLAFIGQWPVYEPVFI